MSEPVALTIIGAQTAAVQEVKGLYLLHKHRKCSKRALQLIQELSVNNNNVHPLHLAALYFYAGLSYDTLSRNMPYRSELILTNLDLAHNFYLQALSSLEAPKSREKTQEQAQKMPSQDSLKSSGHVSSKIPLSPVDKFNAFQSTSTLLSPRPSVINMNWSSSSRTSDQIDSTLGRCSLPRLNTLPYLTKNASPSTPDKPPKDKVSPWLLATVPEGEVPPLNATQTPTVPSSATTLANERSATTPASNSPAMTPANCVLSVQKSRIASPDVRIRTTPRKHGRLAYISAPNVSIINSTFNHNRTVANASNIPSYSTRPKAKISPKKKPKPLQIRHMLTNASPKRCGCLSRAAGGGSAAAPAGKASLTGSPRREEPKGVDTPYPKSEGENEKLHVQTKRVAHFNTELDSFAQMIRGHITSLERFCERITKKREEDGGYDIRPRACTEDGKFSERPQSGDSRDSRRSVSSEKQAESDAKEGWGEMVDRMERLRARDWKMPEFDAKRIQQLCDKAMSDLASH